MLYNCASFVFCIPLSAEQADGSTFVHISLTEEEMEHISHMNRDAVCIMAIFLLVSTSFFSLWSPCMFDLLAEKKKHLCR